MMQAPVRYCLKCGHANQALFQFCASCSNPLPPVMAAPPPMVPMMPPPGYAWSPYGWQDMEREKEIKRTRIGVMLLMVGFGISWIPLVGAIGVFMVFIGLIFIGAGRRAFGPTHARNVMMGVGLWILGVVLAGVTGFLGAFRILPLVTPTFDGVVTADDLIAFFDIVFIGTIITGAVTGVMTVLLGVALSEKRGRILLMTGVVASIIVGIVFFLLIRPGTVDMVQTTAPMAAYRRITDLVGLSSTVNVASYALYALAYYFIYTRIKKREIPGKPPDLASPPGFAPMPMPFPGSPMMPPSQPPAMPPASGPGTPPGPATRP